MAFYVQILRQVEYIIEFKGRRIATLNQINIRVIFENAKIT